MTKREIIAELARERVVEGMARSITHRPVTGDICDLCQIVYLYLLEYPEERLVDLYANGQIGFLIARIVLNQYRSKHSRYYYDFVKWPRRMAPEELAINKADDNG